MTWQYWHVINAKGGCWLTTFARSIQNYNWLHETLYITKKLMHGSCGSILGWGNGPNLYGGQPWWSRHSDECLRWHVVTITCCHSVDLSSLETTRGVVRRCECLLSSPCFGAEVHSTCYAIRHLPLWCVGSWCTSALGIHTGMLVVLCVWFWAFRTW
jgi:hypothetical protein